jgi:hypothetical protein
MRRCASKKGTYSEDVRLVREDVRCVHLLLRRQTLHATLIFQLRWRLQQRLQVHSQSSSRQCGLPKWGSDDTARSSSAIMR